MRNSGKLFLAGSFDDANLNGESDYESNGSAHSGFSDGVSIFCNFHVCSRYHSGIYRDSMAQHGNDLDGSAYRHVGNTRGPSASASIDAFEDRTVRALRSRGVETPPYHPRSQST